MTIGWEHGECPDCKELTKRLDEMDDAVADSFEGITKTVQMLNGNVDLLVLRAVPNMMNLVLLSLVSNLLLIIAVVTLFIIK